MYDVEPTLVWADKIVREIQSSTYTACDIRRQMRGNWLPQFPMSIDNRPHRRTLNELHGDEEFAGDLAQLINLDDVAVHQVGREFRLVYE